MQSTLATDRNKLLAAQKSRVRAVVGVGNDVKPVFDQLILAFHDGLGRSGFLELAVAELDGDDIRIQPRRVIHRGISQRAVILGRYLGGVQRGSGRNNTCKLDAAAAELIAGRMIFIDLELLAGIPGHRQFGRLEVGMGHSRREGAGGR